MHLCVWYAKSLQNVKYYVFYIRPIDLALSVIHLLSALKHAKYLNEMPFIDEN